MPQMPAKEGSMLTFCILFNSLKIDSWLNLVMPVRNTKRNWGSKAFKGE